MIRILLLCLLMADTLHLKSGGTVEGKIVSDKGDSYKVELATGTITVAKKDVDHVEFGPSPAEELERRRKALNPRDAKAVLELAKWAAARSFTREALELARSCDDPACREFVLAAIEPEVRRRVEEAKKVFTLGLLRRGREIVAALETDYPEAAERARALIPSEVKPRRYDIDLTDRLKAVEAAVNDWFERGTPFKVEAPVAEVMAAIRRGTRPPAGARTGLLDRKTADGVPYLLRIPAAYDPETPMRLLVTLHGTGGSPQAALSSWGRSLDGESDLIVAAPDAGLPSWGNSRAGHDRILSVVRDVSAAYAVDLDRVCIDGGSMGAHGAFFLAMYHPDRWAAIAPRCGSARFFNIKFEGGVPDISAAPPMLDNLWRTPTFLIAGARDRKTPIEEVRITQRRLAGLGAPIVYREFPDGGHEWYSSEDRDVLDFLRFHRRDPFPRRVRYTTREPAFGRSYWVEILRASRPTRIEITHMDMRGEPIETRPEYDRPVEVDATADAAKNRITVEAKGAKELRIWLADGLVDLDRPVRIVVNKYVLFEGVVKRSVDLALEDCKARRDRGMPYPARVDVTLK